MTNRHEVAKQMTTEQSAGAASYTHVLLARDQLAHGKRKCTSAPGAYREGGGSGQMGHDEILATAAHKLAE
jgi:hypothetical protein